jgi:hypothetical protein
LKEARADPAVDLSLERQPARRAYRTNPPRQVSELHHHQQNMAVQQEGAGLLQLHQAQVRLVVLRTFHSSQSRVGLERWKLNAGGRHLQPVQVHRNVAPEQSEGNLARRLRVRVPANREAEKSEANLESIDLQPRRLPAQVPMRCKVEERGDKAPTVNLAGSQGAERQLRLSKGRGRGSQSAERKRERGLHRQDHNNSCWFSKRLRNEKSGAAFCIDARFL